MQIQSHTCAYKRVHMYVSMDESVHITSTREFNCKDITLQAAKAKTTNYYRSVSVSGAFAGVPACCEEVCDYTEIFFCWKM